MIIGKKAIGTGNAKFALSLWFACLFNGGMKKFRALYAQAYAESGHDFSSELFTKYNNAFGMGFPSVRPAANIGSISLNDNLSGTPMLFSVYKSLYQSCKDRLLWDKYNHIKFTSTILYMERVVEKGYATDPLYLGNWVAIEDQNNIGAYTSFANVIGWVALVAVPVVAVMAFVKLGKPFKKARKYVKRKTKKARSRFSDYRNARRLRRALRRA